MKQEIDKIIKKELGHVVEANTQFPIIFIIPQCSPQTSECIDRSFSQPCLFLLMKSSPRLAIRNVSVKERGQARLGFIVLFLPFQSVNNYNHTFRFYVNTIEKIRKKKDLGIFLRNILVFLEENTPDLHLFTRSLTDGIILLTIVFANVKNLKYASMFGGSLSGLAPSVNVSTGRLGEGCVTEAFQGHKTDETTLELSVRIFGHCPRLSEGKTNRHVLTIYCVMEDGTQWYHSVDITDQLHAEDPQPTPAPGEEEKVINIALEDLPLPEPMGDGEGGMFQPTIDGWQGVEIDVSIDY